MVSNPTAGRPGEEREGLLAQMAWIMEIILREDPFTSPGGALRLLFLDNSHPQKC